MINVAANEAEDDEAYDIPGEIENVVGVLKPDRSYRKACKLSAHQENGLFSAKKVKCISALT